MVYVDDCHIEQVADQSALRPGVNASAYTYDFALNPEVAPLAPATQSDHNRVVNRMLYGNESAGDLLNKLEAVRLLCQETGCAQRNLAHDALNGLTQVTARIDDAHGTTSTANGSGRTWPTSRTGTTLGVAMTDAKGDRSRRPHEQANRDTYVHVVQRSANGIVISGSKAIVTGAP